MDYTYSDISRMIDHSLLKPSLTFEDFETGCRLAIAYEVGSVCIQPHYLKRCAEILAGSGVKASLLAAAFDIANDPLTIVSMLLALAESVYEATLSSHKSEKVAMPLDGVLIGVP